MWFLSVGGCLWGYPFSCTPGHSQCCGKDTGTAVRQNESQWTQTRWERRGEKERWERGKYTLLFSGIYVCVHMLNCLILKQLTVKSTFAQVLESYFHLAHERKYLVLPPFPYCKAMDGWLTYLYNPHLLYMWCIVELIHNFFLSLNLWSSSCLRDRSWCWFTSGEGGCILAAGEAGSGRGENQPTEMVREENSQLLLCLIGNQMPLLFEAFK